MTKQTALFLALALLSSSCQRTSQPVIAVDPHDGAADQANGDLALLVGKWKIERALADDKNYSVSYRQAKFEIAAGGKYIFAIPGLVEENGTITVNSDKNPKEMDWTPAGQAMNRLQPAIDGLQDALGQGRKPDGPRRLPVQRAIYKLDGDDLTICLSMLENQRPTEFKTHADSWRVLMTCKRKKDADKPKGQAAPAAKPLPHEVQQAWVQAGAEPGWMGIMSETVALDFKPTPEEMNDAVPAFRFKVWTEGTASKLPSPKTPFGLFLVGTEATDAELKELATLESLQMLDLSFTKLSDAGLKNLSSMKSLTVLDLFATQVTDVGMKELAKLQNLQALDLRVLPITDAGLKELAGLKSLKTLDLIGTKITDAGLKGLAGMTSLRHLDVTDSKVTEAGVKELQQVLPHCQILY